MLSKDSKEALSDMAVAQGAYKASVIPAELIPFDPSLRQACAANTCGNYGKNWTCPPDVGPIDELIVKARQYKHALVFQTVSVLEDSYDFEGMMAALRRHREVTDRITDAVREAIGESDILQLSAGGCVICETCAKRQDLPCVHPDRALASLEAYGIYVSKLAELAGMNYINGKNTVTYFGAYLFS